MSPAPLACAPVLGRMGVRATGSRTSSSRSVMPYSNVNGIADSCPSEDDWYSKLVPACTAPFRRRRAVSVSSTCALAAVAQMMNSPTTPDTTAKRRSTLSALKIVLLGCGDEPSTDEVN